MRSEDAFLANAIRGGGGGLRMFYQQAWLMGMFLCVNHVDQIPLRVIFLK